MSGFSQTELGRIRAQTPGCANVIHFNNAGASLMPRPVIDTVVKQVQVEGAIGGYEAEAQAADRIRGVYESAAQLIGCSPEEVALIENATRAFDMAFYAIPFQPGDIILTSMAEYGSNYLSYLQMAGRGVEVRVVPNDENGQVSISEIEKMIDPRVRLISLTHVPTNGGLVQPAAQVGRIARQAGILYLLDACQSVGQMPLDVGEIGCDMLSATSRKYLRGPRGAGFLYVRKDVVDSLVPPFLDVRSAEWTGPSSYLIRQDARRFENWESNVAGKLGMGAAIDYALSLGMARIWDRVRLLADLMRKRLRQIPGVALHDRGNILGGIVAFSVAGMNPSGVKADLGRHRINVSVSDTSSTLLDMRQKGLDSLVRASVHYYNTEDEVDELVKRVSVLAGA